MNTAAMPTVLKTICTIILFYYLFKFGMRLLAPYLLRKVAKKAEEHLKNQFNQQQNQQTNYQQNNEPKRDKNNIKPTKKVGEYIDFEEVE
jgi:hypothetical protein